MIRQIHTDPRDRQRSKAYAFDTWVLKNVDTGCFSLEDCALIVQICLAHFKMNVEKMPKIKDGRGCRWARGGPSCIVLPKWSRNMVIVAHEAAHCIAMRVFHLPEAHGAEWMRIYCHLLSKLHKVDESWLVENARKQGLRVAPAELIPAMKKYITEKGL